MALAFDIVLISPDVMDMVRTFVWRSLFEVEWLYVVRYVEVKGSLSIFYLSG